MIIIIFDIVNWKKLVTSAGQVYTEIEKEKLNMTTKEKVVKAVHDLPEDASIEDAMERLFLISKIEKGIEQADAGQTLTHAQVREKMQTWLK